MILDFVEVCGFRGFRDKTRVSFGSGFTVIAGRNGVGKSTICDAVEFAVTGSIDKYAVERAAQESVDDYFWWIGEGKPEDHYVIVSFKRENGESFSIRRSRTSGSDKTVEQIENALCNNIRPDDAARQLCKTSIIRDEWIAALSLDLSEIERFELVRSALGPVQAVDFSAKAKAVLKAIETSHADKQVVYNNARSQLTNGLARLSEAKEEMSRAGDVSSALQVLDDALLGVGEELTARIIAGRELLTRGRARLVELAEVITFGRELLALKQDANKADAVQMRESALTRFKSAMKSQVMMERLAADAERDLEIEERANEIAASLGAIIEHGEKLGRHDERCPLCSASRTNQEFSVGLSVARERMENLASGFTAARERASVARESLKQATLELEQAKESYSYFESIQTNLEAREKEYIKKSELQGLAPRLLNDIEALENVLTKERDRLIDLEKSLATLDASYSVSKLASLEERIITFREEADAAAAGVEKSERALSTAKAVDRSVRSISGEIIDERLAQISPLLNELYQRLRPHYDWRSIEYSIRGDVRRFLSLKVGNGLNPQFVFSSGQRRAAGLAFLLSVHLARAWTPWRTLLLDDPVQHIDDFRALHLIEVLGALRLDGRQIVCAVEDPALAELLCRRLVSTPEAIGKRYDIDIGPGGSAAIVSDAVIPPMPTSVLRSLTKIHAVGE
tara:strand:- start:175 stop:2238 length:2064 start_codon:yes stop_codon:yes gene_type:complete